MTMVLVPRIALAGRMARRHRMAGRVLVVLALAWFGAVGSLTAQEPPVHYRQSGDMPPGAIGRDQLQRGGPLPGYFQPVEISAPQGALISLAVDGRFDRAVPDSRLAGMLIGSVYRLRVTGIAHLPGIQVFPSVEVINRLYPPPGQALKFPVQIELTEEELTMASHGIMVTRVIYLEDPQLAVPARQIDGKQQWFEAAQGEDPLRVADQLGRPMAILRMGGIVPLSGEADPQFMFGSPPLLCFESTTSKLPAGSSPRPSPENAEPVPAPPPSPNILPPAPSPSDTRDRR